MRAMILAAGRGERMGELTQHTPKPLVKVKDAYLIEYAIWSLVKAGVKDIVINVSYLADQIQQALGDGSRYGVRFIYSIEPERLETGGGIFKALPLLGDQAFIVISADVITDYPLEKLSALSSPNLAHLVMVDNPDYCPQGDFGLSQGKIMLEAANKLTYASLSLLHPDLFADCQPGHFRLAQPLKAAIEKGLVSGEHYHGVWHNVGSPQDLALLI